MSSKLFLSVSLVSLALVSVGCNANLSTGHPNTSQPAAAAAAAQAAKVAAASKQAAVIKSTGTSAANGQPGTLDSELSGTFKCEGDRSADPCLSNEQIVVSDDLKTLTISYTNTIGKSTASCDQVITVNLDLTTVAIADDGTKTSNNTATVTGEFEPTQLGPNSSSNTDCQAALKALTPNTKLKQPLTLQVGMNKEANDELHYTVVGEKVDLKLERVSSDDSSSTTTTPPGTSGASGSTSSGAASATPPAAPVPGAAAPATENGAVVDPNAAAAAAPAPAPAPASPMADNGSGVQVPTKQVELSQPEVTTQISQ